MAQTIRAGKHSATVGDFEMVKSPNFNKLQSLSTSGPQQLQQHHLEPQISTNFNNVWNLVRDQGAEVQIHVLLPMSQAAGTDNAHAEWRGGTLTLFKETGIYQL
jgi:hypothetical protein